MDAFPVSREAGGEGRSGVVPGRAGPVRGGGAVGQRGRGRRPPLPPRQRRTQPRRPRNILIGLARRTGHLLGHKINRT